MKTVTLPTDEPSLQTALGWWDELPDKWTPIGWKDHMFRFNILWNGTIIPFPNPAYGYDAKEWQEQTAQLTFDYALYGSPQIRDNNSVIQGWNDHPAPVLWSRWIPCVSGRLAPDGIEVRQEVFAHIPGAKDLVTGIEPLFLWIRLSIVDQCEGLPLDPTHTFRVKINLPHVFWGGMIIRHNLTFNAEKSLYPKELRAQNEAYDRASGHRLLEPDGKVRLAVAPGQNCEVAFQTRVETHLKTGQTGIKGGVLATTNDSVLSIEVKNKIGASVDLLFPLLSMPRTEFDRELELGFDGALREANRYWSRIPKTAARIQVPEELINQTALRHIQMCEIIAQKHYETGRYHPILSSWIYGDPYFATSTSMTLVMALDMLGHHDAVRKYLNSYRLDQGKHVASGDFFGPHPGFLARPGWVNAHGGVLWAMAEHGLMTGDENYLREFTPTIVKACEWIEYAREIKGHGGVEGIMPPAHATDNDTRIQATWNDGWMYKGLATAARLLRRIGHPRANEFTRGAEEYRRIFGRALRAATRKMPVWKDKRGNKHHLVPLVLDQSNENVNETRNTFYFDCGPLFLIFAGLIDADDDMMHATAKWFREGPPTRFRRHESNCFLITSLKHEMPVNEIIFAWNVFYSWQLGDRQRFLEGMYSLFAAGMSRQTFTICECRGGVTGLSPCTPILYHARQAVIDDQLREDELHLLRLVPLAWLRSDRMTIWENAPTEFGPVTLQFGLSRDGRRLRVEFEPQYRIIPEKIVLHIPPVRSLIKISLNGKSLAWNKRQKSINIK